MLENSPKEVFRKSLRPLRHGILALSLLAWPGLAAEKGESPGRATPTQSAPKAEPMTSPKAAAMEPVKQMKNLAKPKVEVQRGSGDFTTFHDTAVVDGTTAVRLRWSPTTPAAKARWSIRASATGPPSGERSAPPDTVLPVAPGLGQWAYFDVTLFTKRANAKPAGPTRYVLRLTALDAQGQGVGLPSDPIVIDYQPPGSGPAQTFELDQVQLLDWTPKSGTMNGTNDGKQYSYGPDQKVDYRVQIDLVTEAPARLSAYLIGKDGRSLEGNFYAFVDVDTLGAHQEDGWVTIRCDSGNPYYDQAAYGLGWKLYRKGSGDVLTKGEKKFSQPLTWVCPGNDQLALTSMSPATGTLMGIGTPSDASKPGRSVRLNYHYTLNTQPKAVVKLRLFGKNHQDIPHEYWEDTQVGKGDGSVSQRLSVYCQSEQQPDAIVKHLRYTLSKEGSGETIIQKVVDVDWRFRCKPETLTPAGIQQAPSLVPMGSKARGKSNKKVVPGSSALPKAAPSRVRKGSLPAPTGKIRKMAPTAPPQRDVPNPANTSATPDQQKKTRKPLKLRNGN